MMLKVSKLPTYVAKHDAGQYGVIIFGCVSDGAWIVSP